MPVARVALALVALALPAAARAHGVRQEVERRGASVAVRVSYERGAPLAGAIYQVIRPGKPERVVREGRTDPQGWVEFVPDAPGRWLVRIVDATGHGRVVIVDVPGGSPPPATPASKG